jgi:hypothetical protein
MAEFITNEESTLANKRAERAYTPEQTAVWSGLTHCAVTTSFCAKKHSFSIGRLKPRMIDYYCKRYDIKRLL